MLQLFFKTTVLFVIAAFGYLLRARGAVDRSFNRQLALLLVNVFYPALIVTSITGQFTWRTLARNWALPAGAALIMLVGWAAGCLCLPLLRACPPPTRAVFLLQTTLNNYSFLPIILATMLLGEDGVARVVFSTLGAEVVVWTLGVRLLAGKRAGAAEGLRNLLSPPMLALLAGIALLLLREAGGSFLAALAANPVAGGAAGAVAEALRMTGQATIPVSAIIVGIRMADLGAGQLFAPLPAGIAVLRLLAIPALATALFLRLPLVRETRLVLLLVAVQPCAMASVTLAEAYDSDSRLAAASVFLTHLLCLATIPLWLSAPWWRGTG